MQEKGTISVSTENIFPIIKKFLYSDHEIFLRELVANAVDATQKLRKLASMGEFQGELGEQRIRVSVDKEAKTLTISDRGVGMTAAEIGKYINQIAFSGATEFLEKYKNVSDTGSIIGKFGLGFYSAFMVANRVELTTRSWQPDTAPARWSCDGTTEFEISPAEKEERGTEIVLHINNESEEFLEAHRIRSILSRYCRFLPVEIEFEGELINETAPIWSKAPADLKEEDYLKFYEELYPMQEKPMFWIHLNVDYPFNLTGVLYFPKVKQDITQHRNKIQLYSRQMFITDEVKDVVPEFLMLLHGVLDSPDIPLNVSRSYLQSDGNVKKINSYVTRKVADKLEELFRNDRAGYEQKWESIGMFVKYGMLTDDKFREKARKFCLLQNLDGNHFTIEEYIGHVEALQTDKNGSRVFIYTTDAEKQDAYIGSARRKGYDVLRLDGLIDSHFISTLETKEEKLTLKRVDSDTVEKLVEKEEKLEPVLSQAEQDKVKELFKKALGNDNLDIAIEAMPAEELPVTLVLPEFMRRMKEMSEMQGFGFGNMPDTTKVVVNGNHAFAAQLVKEGQDEESLHERIRQAYDLARLAQNMLTGQRLTQFIQRSFGLIS